MKLFFWSFLSSGFTGAATTQFIRKIRFVNATCLLLILFTHILGVIHFLRGEGYLAILDSLIVIIFVIIMVFLRISKHLEGASSLLLLLLINISQFLLITNTISGFAIIWIFLFPIVAFLLKNELQALIWCAAEFLGLFAVCILVSINLTVTSYTLTELFIVSIGFFLFSLLTKYLVGTSRIGEEVLIKKSNELYKSNMQLAQEVRERKDTELTLKQENVRDEAIFSSIGEGMIVVDQDFVIVMINKAAKNLLDMTEEDLKGKIFFDKIHLWSEDKKKIPRGHDIISDSFSNKSIQNTNKFYLGKNPENTVPVALIVSPILLYQKVVGGVITFRDISQEKAIDRMKTEFISLASHQLRTPLTAMKWFLEMLLSGDLGQLSDEQKKYIQNISDSNEKEIALVNSLLNISRIESGRIIIEPVLTQLNTLIQQGADEQKVPLETKKQKLSLVLDESLPEIPLDTRMIHEVIMNLLTNAIKYTPNEGSIVVSTDHDDKNILLKVTDTGYGIPEKEKGRIFERFFRASNITKIVTDGSGLGLYLVKKIIDASDGTIELESKEGEGTEFTIKLPREGMRGKKGEAKLT